MGMVQMPVVTLCIWAVCAVISYGAVAVLIWIIRKNQQTITLQQATNKELLATLKETYIRAEFWREKYLRIFPNERAAGEPRRSLH